MTSLAVDIRLVPLFGHTAGHSGVAVNIGGAWTLHVGDAYYLRAELVDSNHPIDTLATLRADDDAMRRESLAKLRTLSHYAHSRLRIIGYHDASELPSDIPAFNDGSVP